MIRFTIPTPASSKNSREIVWRNGKPRSVKNQKAHASMADVMEAASRAMQKARARRIEDDDVRVTMVHDVEAEMLHVTVRRKAARPTGRTGRRRDLANLSEVVLDGMQRIVFKNDNQVADLRMVRMVRRPSTD